MLETNRQIVYINEEWAADDVMKDVVVDPISGSRVIWGHL